MLSVTSCVMQPQLSQPLLQIVSQYSSLRPSRFASLESRRPTNARKKNEPRKSTASSAEVVCLITDEMCLNFALTGRLRPPILRHQASALSPQWSTSHVSTPSFEMNKRLYSTMSPANTSLIRRVLNLEPRGNSRGFKTRRTTSEQAPLAIALTDIFKLKKDSVQDVKDTRLNELLKAEESEEAKQAIKIAFAEGYAASAPKARPASRTRGQQMFRYLKHLQTILSVSFFIIMISMFSGVIKNSNLRMQFRNGSEISPESISVTFEDVRGVEEAKVITLLLIRN